MNVAHFGCTITRFGCGKTHRVVVPLIAGSAQCRMLCGPTGLPGNIHRRAWVKPSLCPSDRERSRKSPQLPCWVVLWSTIVCRNSTSRRVLAERDALHALVRATSACLSFNTTKLFVWYIHIAWIHHTASTHIVFAKVNKYLLWQALAAQS